MMSNNIYVGIDYSLVSPAMCLIHNGNFNWISLYKTTEEEQNKLLKKTEGPFSVLDSSKAVSIHFLNKLEKQEGTYSHTERTKLSSHTEQVQTLLSIIKEATSKYKGDVYIAMEGVSFGSPGNTLIDICMATGMFRQGLTDKILDGKVEKLYVFSPGTIKKFAFKGNAQKSELYDALLLRDDLSHLELTKLMSAHKDSWVTPGGNVKKPLDDLVDATWISLLLRETVEGRFAEENKSVKTSKSKRKKQKAETA